MPPLSLKFQGQKENTSLKQMASRTNEQTEIQKRASRAKARAFKKELSTELLTKKIS